MLFRRAGSSGISWRTLSLVKKTLYRHRAGFEPKRASSFRKWVKNPPNTRRSHPSLSIDPSLVLPFILLVVLASSTSGDQQFCEIITGAGHDDAEKLIAKEKTLTL